MKTKQEIKERISTLEFNNSLIKDPKGHEMNEMRGQELKDISEMSFSELRNRFDFLKKQRTREADARREQIKWVLE